MTRMLATVLTCVALGSAVAVLVLTASWRAALRTLLELLTAAGLVRLAGAQNWTDLAAAAAIVALRKVLSTVLLSPTGVGAGLGVPGRERGTDRGGVGHRSGRW